MKEFLRLSVGLILMVSISLLACGQKNYDEKLASLYKNSVPLMQSATLDSLQQHRTNMVLLDTRAPEEYNVSHLPEAQLVDYDSFDINQLSSLSKEDTVVVYCSVGYRSERVGEAMKEAGFQHVYNLYGGIFQWKNEDKEIINSHNQPTDSVHTYNRNWSKWLRNGVKVY
ncbi:MAG: rhodanese-like domain-containing protein [Tunicatimonas sp.]|uniref:rhodanese-like domain-containing protein n=1 Tax=Tunicatimonas sp. TaxID=1940096 RepID=UPI003C711B5F